MNNKHIKIIVTGDGSVGKTSMLLRYTDDKFQDNYEATVFDSYSVQVRVDNVTYTLDLTDTAGQEDYDAMRPLTYSSADIFLLCFESTNPDSLENLKNKWIPEKNEKNKDKPFIIVGTKVDLRDDESKVKALLQTTGKSPIYAADMEDMQSEFPGCIKILECSAKSATGVKEVFDEAVRHVILDRIMKERKRKCTIS